MELKVLFLFLWSCSAPAQSSVIQRKYWYHSQAMTRKKAQNYCDVAHGGNLATVETNADLTKLNLKPYYAWIGLRKVNGSWESVSSSSTLSLNWDMKSFTVEGDEPGKECGKLHYPKKTFVPKAYATQCNQKNFVVCEDANDQYFFPKAMSWDDGLMFCKSQNMHYMDTGLEGFYRSPVTQPQDFPVWIGLNRKDSGLGLCLAVSSQNKTMSEKQCSESYPFLCYRNNLVLLKEELGWEDALETCRNLKNTYNLTSFDLLSVEEHELDYVLSYTKGATTSKVWVGLRFLAGVWFWANHANASLPSLSSCPGLGLRCGALVLSSGSDPVIEATDCNEKLNAFCYDSKP